MHDSRVGFFQTDQSLRRIFVALREVLQVDLVGDVEPLQAEQE